MATDNSDRILRLLDDMEGPVTIDAADVRRLLAFAGTRERAELAPPDRAPGKAGAGSRVADFARWLRERTRGGFPEGRRGDISGWNGLFRINWFNGRYLTAEALKAQDVYWDHRNRILGRIFPQGVSWGLGLSLGGGATPDYGEEVRGGETRLPEAGTISGSEVVTLSPGEALDGIGRPIVVGTPYRFCFNDLIRAYRAAPKIVELTGSRFLPCVCLKPDPEGPREPGPAIRPGPYVLCIEPEETPEGEAARYGELCGHEKAIHCEADGWRGGFGLSLAYFPVPLPGRAVIRNAWDLRGVLSAYYYNVFEHDLTRRWDRPFALDRGFCEPTGPSLREGGCVPLALVYVAQDGSLSFLDPWIPRRPLAATAARASSRGTIGAPSDAAAFARIHQFQCMLAESLSVSPMRFDPATRRRPLNLYDRGFRNIPPVGFLPVDPLPVVGDDAAAYDPKGTIGAVLQASPQAALVVGLRAAAAFYFRGTSVYPYYVVALHDDDLLEDVGNVFDKDPVVLADPRRLVEEIAADRPPLHEVGDDPKYSIGETVRSAGYGLQMTSGLSPFSNFVTGFGGRVWQLVSAMDELVNRRIEIVKVIIPLQGLRRPHPVLGETEADAMPALRRLALEVFGVDLGGLEGQRLEAAGRLPLSIPRHFVCYVKQRLVVLDALYLLFAILTLTRQKYPQVWSAMTYQPEAGMASFGEAAGNVAGLDLSVVREALAGASESDRAVLAGAVALPEVRRVLAESAFRASPSLAEEAVWSGYRKAVDERAAALADEEPDAEAARARALVEVSEAYALERPGFEPIAALALVLDGRSMDLVLRDVETIGTRDLSTLAPARGLSLAESELAAGAPAIFADDRSKSLYAGLRAGLSARKASDFVSGLESEVSVGEVLALPEDEAADLLGGKAKLTAFLRKARPALKKTREDAVALARNEPSEAMKRRYAELVSAGSEPTAALDKVAEEFAASSENRELVAALREAAKTTGEGDRTRLAGALFRAPALRPRDG